jgi:hypothetical protein
MHFPSYKTLVRASSIGSAKAAERTVLLRCCANRGRALGPWKAQHAASKCSIMRRDEGSRVFADHQIAESFVLRRLPRTDSKSKAIF